MPTIPWLQDRRCPLVFTAVRRQCRFSSHPRAEDDLDATAVEDGDVLGEVSGAFMTAACGLSGSHIHFSRRTEARVTRAPKLACLGCCVYSTRRSCRHPVRPARCRSQTAGPEGADHGAYLRSRRGAGLMGRQQGVQIVAHLLSTKKGFPEPSSSRCRASPRGPAVPIGSSSCSHSNSHGYRFPRVVDETASRLSRQLLAWQRVTEQRTLRLPLTELVLRRDILRAIAESRGRARPAGSRPI